MRLSRSDVFCRTLAFLKLETVLVYVVQEVSSNYAMWFRNRFTCNVSEISRLRGWAVGGDILAVKVVQMNRQQWFISTNLT